MDAALQKALGGLVLSAVPTIVILALLFFAYTFLVHRPLKKVLAERYALTAGAIARAKADVAAADAKTADYEQRLRQARAQLYKQLEGRRKQHLEARSAVLAEARTATAARVKLARAELEKEASAAKAGLQAQAEALANEVVQAVLRPVSASRSSASPVAGAQP